jgi:hypothetical protein
MTDPLDQFRKALDPLDPRDSAVLSKLNILREIDHSKLSDCEGILMDYALIYLDDLNKSDGPSSPEGTAAIMAFLAAPIPTKDGFGQILLPLAPSR